MPKSKKPELDLSLSDSVSSLDDTVLENAGAIAGGKKKTEKVKLKDVIDSDLEEMLQSPSSSSDDDEQVQPSSSKKGRGRKSKKKNSGKLSDDDEDDGDSINDADIRNIGARLGLLFDAEDLEGMVEEDDRVPLDPIIEELLNKGLGKGKTAQKKEKKLQDQITSLSAHTDLDISSEGRLAVLVEDVETVRKTKEKVDALIKVLEATRDKLIKEDASLKYTEPPSKTKPPNKSQHLDIDKKSKVVKKLV